MLPETVARDARAHRKMAFDSTGPPRTWLFPAFTSERLKRTMPAMVRSQSIGGFGRLALLASLAAVVAVGLGPAAHPAPVRAGTADTMEATLLSGINAERAKLGLVPLRLHAGLVDMAGDRAAAMASAGAMSHTKCLSCELNARGIQWWGVGEVIAANNYPWGSQSAQVLLQSWLSSSVHRAILMSSTFNYIGIGVAYRSANSTTYGAAVLTESADRTGPWARMGTVARSGTTVTWTWTGADTMLQTHTAGLKSFDVQYRVGSGSWSTIKSGTTAKSLALTSRAHGYYYGLRVRSRDNLGHLCGYTAELRIWVP